MACLLEEPLTFTIALGPQGNGMTRLWNSVSMLQASGYTSTNTPKNKEVPTKASINPMRQHYVDHELLWLHAGGWRALVDLLLVACWRHSPEADFWGCTQRRNFL